MSDVIGPYADEIADEDATDEAPKTAEELLAEAHAEALEMFDLCKVTDADNRDLAEQDIRFVKKREQWPAGVREAREREGRPCLTIDQLNLVVRQVVNDARLNKPQIKVKPVDGNSDPETADILAGLIRNIEYSSNADVAYDTAIDYAVTCGRGYFRINTKYASDDTFDQDIVIERIPDPMAVYGDPFSTAADSSDWNCAFICEPVTRQQYERRYPGAEVTSFDGFDGLDAPWYDGDSVMIAEYWKREEVETAVLMLSNGEVVKSDVMMANEEIFSVDFDPETGEPIPVTVLASRPIKSYKVMQYVLSGKEILATNDWPGQYIPIVPVYGDEFVHEGERWFVGLTRPAMDAQRMKNYWRSTTTELVALAPKTPYIGTEEAFNGVDADKWATANSESHAFISHPKNTAAPVRQPYAGIPAGALQEAMQAGDDIKSITGIYDASLGARSNETSGVAINARKREGDVSTFHYIDNLARGIGHGGRIIVDLIPHVYSSLRVLRTLDIEGKPTPVQVGPPEDAQRAAMEAAQAGKEMDAVQRIYTLGVGKYDVAVEAGPSFTTQREEAREYLTELLRAAPQYADIIGPLIVKNMDFPGVDKVIEAIEERVAASQEGPQPDPAAMAEQQAKIQEMTIKAQEAQMKADLERQKLEVDAYRAETERMKTLHELRQPTPYQGIDYPQM